MESELLRIKCPNCGAVLTIKKIAGLETKSIPCPVCKKASKYIDYKVPKQQYTPKIRVSANFRKLAQVIYILYP